MQTGVQFTGTIAAGDTQQWQTVGWPDGWHVIWTLVPTTAAGAGGGSPQLTWELEVERGSGNLINYWFTVQNLSQASIDFEARYAVVYPEATPAEVER